MNDTETSLESLLERCANFRSLDRWFEDVQVSWRAVASVPMRRDGNIRYDFISAFGESPREALENLLKKQEE